MKTQEQANERARAIRILTTSKMRDPAKEAKTEAEFENQVEEMIVVIRQHDEEERKAQRKLYHQKIIREWMWWLTTLICIAALIKAFMNG